MRADYYRKPSIDSCSRVLSITAQALLKMKHRTINHIDPAPDGSGSFTLRPPVFERSRRSPSSLPETKFNFGYIIVSLHTSSWVLWGSVNTAVIDVTSPAWFARYGNYYAAWDFPSAATLKCSDSYNSQFVEVSKMVQPRPGVLFGAVG